MAFAHVWRVALSGTAPSANGARPWDRERARTRRLPPRSRRGFAHTCTEYWRGGREVEQRTPPRRRPLRVVVSVESSTSTSARCGAIQGERRRSPSGKNDWPSMPRENASAPPPKPGGPRCFFCAIRQQPRRDMAVGGPTDQVAIVYFRLARRPPTLREDDFVFDWCRRCVVDPWVRLVVAAWCLRVQKDCGHRRQHRPRPGNASMLRCSRR